MPWPSRAYFTAIWTRPTVYGHRVQHGAPEARILLMPKHSCDFLFTKGGWIRRYSIYCILGKNAWSPAMMVSLKYFPIILTKNSPLKFLFHFSLFFFFLLRFCNIRSHGKKVGERAEPSGNLSRFSSSHPCRNFPPLTSLPAYSCFIFSLIRWLTREQTQSVRSSPTENTPC